MVLSFLFYDLNTYEEYDPDEGIELIKASMIADGYLVYGEQCWNDQPPVYNYLLAGCFVVFGKTILVARMLSFCFTALLFLLFIKIFSEKYSVQTAVFVTGLLLISPFFVRMGFSIMIGYPSLIMAMWAFLFLEEYIKTQKWIFLLLSGIVYALSVGSKLIPIYMLPGLFLYFILQDSSTWAKKVFLSMIWLFSFGLSFFAIGHFTGFIYASEMIHSHVNASEGYVFIDNALYILKLFVKMLPIILLAVWAYWRSPKIWDAANLFPVIWLSLSIVVLLIHHPLRYHYCFMITFPLLWILAPYLNEVVLYIQAKRNWTTVQYFLIVIVCFFLMKPLIDREVYVEKPPVRYEEIAALLQNKDEFVFTDRPILAFKLKKLVPPEIAVLCNKRIDAGFMTDEDFLKVLEKHLPNEIVFSRFDPISFGKQSTNFILSQYNYQKNGYFHIYTKNDH